MIDEYFYETLPYLVDLKKKEDKQSNNYCVVYKTYCPYMQQELVATRHFLAQKEAEDYYRRQIRLGRKKR